MWIIFEGPDGVGKSTIARQFAREMGLPYFKNPNEHYQKIEGETDLVTRYACMYFTEYARVAPVHLVMDRFYPSEWVYAQVEQREHDMTLLRALDVRMTQSIEPVYFVICRRHVYEKHVNTGHGADRSVEELRAIDAMYNSFCAWTQLTAARVIQLYTDDEDIIRQCDTIVSAIAANAVV